MCILLQAHLVSHAEIRPYVCEYCDAGFTNSQSLKTHLLSHAQVSVPFIQEICQRVFFNKEYVKGGGSWWGRAKLEKLLSVLKIPYTV